MPSQQYLIPLQHGLTPLKHCLSPSHFHHATFAIQYFKSQNRINMKAQRNQNIIPETRIKRLRAQGYLIQTDQELSELAFGHRFAFQVCTTLLVIGVVTASLPMLSVMLILSFLGMVLPSHPFDYIYNYALASKLNKPRVPKRSAQLKFACAMATVWIATTIILFSSGLPIAGYIMGAMLAVVAITVSTTDFCMPSLIYNTIFNKNI